MMLYPPMSDLVDKVGSRYLLVNLVSRSAREISQKAEAEGAPLARKALSIAVAALDPGKLKVKEEQ